MILKKKVALFCFNFPVSVDSQHVIKTNKQSKGSDENYEDWAEVSMLVCNKRNYVNVYGWLEEWMCKYDRESLVTNA